MQHEDRTPHQPAKENSTPNPSVLESQGEPASNLVAVSFTSDTLGNLRLSSTVATFASVFCLFTAAIPVIQTVALFRMYGTPEGWTSLHVFTCIRMAYTPFWLLVSFQLRKCSLALKTTSLLGPNEIETLIEVQTKLWLALQALLMLIMILFTLMWLYARIAAGLT